MFGALSRLILMGEVVADDPTAFITAIIDAVKSNISLTMVATLLSAIIAAGIVAMFAWKFGRKGFNFVKNALSGKSGKF